MIDTNIGVDEDTRSESRQPRRSRPFTLPTVVQVFGLWLLIGTAGSLVLDGALLFLATTMSIMVLFALSVNVLFGWTGMTSFGQAAYFGAGAYTVALLGPLGLSPVLLLAAGIVVAGALALAFALLAVRLSGVQFAIFTLALAQMLWLITFQISALGGENGIPVSRGELFGSSLFDPQLFWWFVVSMVAVGSYVLRRVHRSSLGMSMNAVRDDPGRAAALGIKVRGVRVLAFVVAGLTGGLAGGLYGQAQGIVSPSVLHWTLSGEVIVMCLIGGMLRFWGPAIGAVLLSFLNWYLFDNVSAPLLYVGLLLLFVVLLLPGGIVSTPAKVSGFYYRRQRRRERA